MKVKRPLNNNVVVAVDNKGNEIVVMGRGLSFSLKKGDPIPKEKIEKSFMLKDEAEMNRFSQVVSEVPIECFTMTERIVDFAKERLGKKLHNSVYVTLTDHINTMIERAKINNYVKSPMLWDIKKLYREEFDIACEIVERFNKKYGTVYDEHEAANITLHLVNAEWELEIPVTMKMTNVVIEILNIVKYHFRIVYDEESLSYYRFVVHLRFFAQRLFSQTTYSDNEDSEFMQHIVTKYFEAYKCAKKVRKFSKEVYEYSFSDEEMIYLTMHIGKVVSDSRKYEYVLDNKSSNIN